MTLHERRIWTVLVLAAMVSGVLAAVSFANDSFFLGAGDGLILCAAVVVVISDPPNLGQGHRPLTTSTPDLDGDRLRMRRRVGDRPLPRGRVRRGHPGAPAADAAADP